MADSVTSPFARKPNFLLQPPDPFDPEFFEEELLEEVNRVGEWLRYELQALQGSAVSAPVLEQMRVTVHSNKEAAVKYIKQNASAEQGRPLLAMIQAAFMEQELLLAAWLKDVEVGQTGEAHLKLDDSTGYEYIWRVMVLAGLFLGLVHVAHAIEDASTRCFMLILCVLALQLSGVVPHYCIGLLVPVFATALRVLPERQITETAHLLFSSMMNDMTALVIGSFTITAIFLRCKLEQRFISGISVWFGKYPRVFMLALMLGCLYASAVTFVTLLALSAMLPICLKNPTSGGKGLLLGVGMSCTLGGSLTPLSGTASVIVLSALNKYGVEVDFLSWILVSLPTMTLLCIILWGMLLLVFGTPPTVEYDEEGATSLDKLNGTHYFFMVCSALFMVGCSFSESLSPFIGSSGNLGLLLTALSYGSGFLSKGDFASMPWDVLMILFGVNVLAFALKESGLALIMANQLIPDQVYEVWVWLELAKITSLTIIIASALTQSVFATLGMPIIVALGAKLRAPFLTSFLANLAIHCAQMAPHSATDLILTSETTSAHGNNRALVARSDFFTMGLGTAVTGWFTINSVGYFGIVQLIGLPPKPIIIREPSELVPSAVWLGNETKAEDKVEILRKQLRGERVNSTMHDRVDKNSRLKKLGEGKTDANFSNETNSNVSSILSSNKPGRLRSAGAPVRWLAHRRPRHRRPRHRRWNLLNTPPPTEA